MKYTLFIVALALTLCGFIAAGDSALTVEKVVHFKLYGQDLKGPVREVIERTYTIRDSTRSLTYEARTKHNKAGQVTQYTGYNMVQYPDRTVLEKAVGINYTYENGRLVKYESFSFDASGEIPEASKRSYINYSYKNSKKASYKAYRYGKYSHDGKIEVLDDHHATEYIQYRKSKLEPIKYEIECDENFQNTRSIKHEVVQGEEKADTTVYVYENGFVVQEISNQLTRNYTYAFDSQGNWIKRYTTLTTDTIVSEVDREIVYW